MNILVNQAGDEAMATKQQGEAGRRGDGVRSDCWVSITLKSSGGIKLDLRSKVESMYGDATRELIRAELTSLGVEHAEIDIDDVGALPFAITARVETAVRRAGQEVGNGFVPDFAPGTQGPTSRDRFRRSRLYLPGNEPKFMVNAGLHGPDAVIYDLEDSVAPTEKDAARILVRNALRAIDTKGAERMVRINQGETGIDDLDFVAPHNPHLILIPKVESPQDVRRVDDRIQAIRGDQACRTQGGHGSSAVVAGTVPRDAEGTVFLMPIIESALGAIHAFEIATACDSIVALAIGLEDYTADIGVPRTQGGAESFWARAQLLNAAKAAGIQAIDTVYSDVADMEGLRDSVVEAKSLGFDGKGCIHPRQIAVMHEAFAPTPSELEKAKKIVAAFEEAERQGLGVVSLGSKMIDPPVVKRALHVVALADTMG